MKARNIGLDIMRSIAIFFVVLIHLLGNFFPDSLGIFWYLAYLGVEMFFVLSGFLIGQILLEYIELEQGRLSWQALGRFYIRRVLRTIPLYYLLLIINFVSGYFLLETVKSFDWRYIFLLQNFTESPPDFFGESWSLAIEEWFYLIFPFGMLGISKIHKGSSRQKSLIYTALFILLITLFRNIYSTSNVRDLNVVVFRLDAIGFGVLVAVLDKYYLSALFKKEYIKFGLIGMCLLMLTICFFLKRSNFASFYLVYNTALGVSVALCLLFFKQFQFKGPLSLLNKIFFFISKISYSVYLINLIVIYTVAKFLDRPPGLQLLISFLLIIICSMLIYSTVEKGFLKFRDVHFPKAYYIKKDKGVNTDTA